MQEWFEQNFSNNCGYTLFSNIIQYAKKQGLDKEGILTLLDGIGLTDAEIEQITITVKED